MHKMVYLFCNGKADGDRTMKNLLGGKGANLHEMTKLGFPVPPGFTITTEVCTYYYQNNNSYPSALEDAVNDALKKVEKAMGTRYGDEENPLLVSVRSGARVSMPGMMDTVLNIGLNDRTVQGLIKQSKDERFSYDAYRRFVQMYSDVVLGVSLEHFETLLTKAKKEHNVEVDSKLPVEVLKSLVRNYKDIVKRELGKPFPDDPKEQLWGAIGAVFKSWMAARAISYRKIHGLPEDWGTAVNVQTMVFGNMGDDCATGVAFTRDPGTGHKRFFGEFLPNAQGEDVVAGIRTPMPINAESATDKKLPTMEQLYPENYKQLVDLYMKLEKHYRDMQDIEFTIQRGKLFMLQTRSGKRTATAAIRIAVDMVHEKLIAKDEAILRVAPDQIEKLLHPRLDPKAPKKVLAKGLPASPGAAAGEVVFSPEDAVELKKDGKDCLLVRHETSPEDIAGMHAAKGILTALGGMTSHAAVVARGMGKPCVAGCGAVQIDYDKQQFKVGNLVIKKGEWMTIDGSTGELIQGHVPTVTSVMDDYFAEFMRWVDERRRLKVRTNSDTPHDTKVARQFGAEGIGLCRTEHMFFGETRIAAVREMILASNQQEREAALEKIFPMQRDDFIGIYREMKGYPVTIRLLDPPLHEFLPKTAEEAEDVSKATGISVETLLQKSKSLHEFNPMLGHRGCRLGITYPEIYKMQVRAIMEAAARLVRDEKFEIEPEIMLPLIGTVEEYKILEADTREVCEKVIRDYGIKMTYRVGTMIEVPRAALVAGKIAERAEFFSFGTNDLTQMTMGMSRDDAGTFLGAYVERGIFKVDPFVSVDQEGVGELMQMAIERGRKANKNLKVGICGEHGGDPVTVEFCDKIGLNYVSCSPFRVPVARVAAAQAVIKASQKGQANEGD